MLITKYNRKFLTTKARDIKTYGGYKFFDDKRTKLCTHPEQRDWTKPCPICKRRVRP